MRKILKSMQNGFKEIKLHERGLIINVGRVHAWQAKIGLDEKSVYFRFVPYGHLDFYLNCLPSLPNMTPGPSKAFKGSSKYLDYWYDCNTYQSWKFS